MGRMILWHGYIINYAKVLRESAVICGRLCASSVPLLKKEALFDLNRIRYI